MNQQGNDKTTTSHKVDTSASHEEPELSSDESVPIDGKDPVGEKMMEDLGKSKDAEKTDAPNESTSKDSAIKR